MTTKPSVTGPSPEGGPWSSYWPDDHKFVPGLYTGMTPEVQKIAMRRITSNMRYVRRLRARMAAELATVSPPP